MLDGTDEGCGAFGFLITWKIGYNTDKIRDDILPQG